MEPVEITADAFPGGRWRARWIWSQAAPITLTPTAEPIIDRTAARGYALLRRAFSLDSVPAEVVARCSADSRYVLWVNGVEVGRGPVRGHPQRLHYDTYDLAPFLTRDENCVAVLARFYGDATPWWMPSTPTFGLGGGAFVFEAALGDPFDEHTPWIVSDEQWRASVGEAWAEVPGAGIGAMAPEVCDGRSLPAGWQSTSFDDSTWSSATKLAANYVGFGGDHRPPSHPYGPMLARPIPQLTGEVRLGQVIAGGVVPAPENEGPLDADPVAQYGADERRAPELAVLPEPEPTLTVGYDAPGTVDVLVIDFGEQVAGHVGIEIDAPAGTRIDAKAAEAIDVQGRLEALQQHSGFRYVARGDEDRFETFDKIGLRYLGLAIRSDAPVTIKAATVRERLFPRHTVTSRAAGDHDDVPFFECSDPLLNDIWRIGRRTVDMCSQDAYLDCPSREQRGWTGDSVVHQLVDFTSNLDWSLARWNVEMAGSPRADGMLPMAAGGDFEWLDRTMIPDWALHWVHALSNVWMYTGDADFVGSLLPVAERVLRWFVPFQDRDGLLEDVTGWVIIDWSAVTTTGKSAALNALWARALSDFATMAEGLGDRGRAAWADERRTSVARGFEQFWDNGREVYVDNIVGATPGRTVSQHSNAAALVAGLVSEQRAPGLAETMTDPKRAEYAAWLAPNREATLEGKGDMYAGFGYLVSGLPEPWWDVEHGIVAAQPFYRYVVHDAVVAAGRADLIPALCRDWQVLLPRCATSWTETWYGGSYCHGWCSTPTRDLVQYTLGVTPAQPGFEVARVAPSLGDLAWAKGAVPTPNGLLRVSVDRERIDVDTPIGVDVSGTRLPPGRHTVERAAR